MPELMRFDSVVLPAPRDPGRSGSILQDLVQALPPAAAEVVSTHRAFFLWLCENSAYLVRLVRHHPEVILGLDATAPEDILAGLMSGLNASRASERKQFERDLRRAKGAVALVTALADLTEYWPVMHTTRVLSEFADEAVAVTIRFLLDEAHRRGKLTAAVDDAASGVIVLAMGKHGAYELNYSSDIDLIFFYEPNILPLADGVEQSKFYIDLARDMRALLQDPTADGYVFRVDLRLRPDPGSTPVALPVPAALIYYEGHGQNWERAAFIKARAIAGDTGAGEAFLAELAPFIWRRNLDFAAIEDVHSMKRQIHAVKGHAQIATAGHNIKLGRGGIREIEFFVQTQQLIAGGREKSLRQRPTLDVLAELAKKGWITEQTAAGLHASYCYLRRLEHRLQMRNDEQTHALPRDQETLEQFAHFAGYGSAAALSEELTQHLFYVAREYGNLFEAAENLSATSGNLVFTGADDDPDTLVTLENMGFQRPADMSAIIRGWHTGRVRAMRSARAREMLTRLKPHLLTALARNGRADENLLRFDKFLSGLPAGVQLFSLFQANPNMLDLVVDIIGTAPRMAEWLSHNANLLDIVLDETGLDALQDPVRIADDLKLVLADCPGDDIIQALDRIRLFVHERQFALGVRLLSEPLDALACGRGFAALADAAVTQALAWAQRDVARLHGHIAAGAMAILAMGKLGSCEMTITSDLDIIVICDAPDFLATSDGAKPLDAETWFARTTRRFLSGLTAPTAQGSLYEVDTRLRPSGNSGPLVSKLSGFAHYQQHEAWTWEHMALTRGRLIAGDDRLRQHVNAIITATLTRFRDAETIKKDIAEMRQRLLAQRTSQSSWDIKHGRGGLFEIEFIAQTLLLLSAHDHSDVLSPHTDLLLHKLHTHKILSDADFNVLSEAWHNFSVLRQILSLCVGPNHAEALPLSTENLLLRATNQPDVARLTSYIAETRVEVAACLDRVLAPLA